MAATAIKSEGFGGERRCMGGGWLCCLGLWHRPFEALVACEQGLRADPKHWRCGMMSALALETLGLLSIAEERFTQAARLSERDAMAAALEGLRRVRARVAKIHSGDPQAGNE